MVNWKIVNKFAWVFGIIFVVFTVLAGLFNYELNKVLYTSAAPESLFTYNVLVAILPFLLAAILSFVVAVFGSQAAKAAEEKEPEMQETKTPEEAEMREKEKQEAETQETEDLFKETPT